MASEFPNPLSIHYILGAIDARPTSYTRQGFIGRKILPEKVVGGDSLTWDIVTAENGLAGIYAVGGRPVPGSDMLYSQAFANLVNLGAARYINRNTVKILRDPGMPNIRSVAERSAATKAREAVNKAIEWCDDRVETLIEYLATSALQGQIDWPPPGLTSQPEWGNATFQLTLPFRSEFKQAATTLTGYDSRTGGATSWKEASSDPVKDLEVIGEYITETTGLAARGSTIVCSSGVLSYLTQNTKLVNRITGTDQGIRFLDLKTFKDFMAENLGYKFVEYDAQYTYRTNIDSDSGPTINAVRFLPRGRCLILPPGEAFGNMVTTESAGPGDQYYTGKFPWLVTDDEPPFETRLGIAGMFFPVMLRPGSIFVFDAWS
jgi:hypothetical protein